ncbi:hypothetical protein [Niveispirillum fermenti]|uniref:hypothetical protein n=1 Tax=Niveispirillum fermenti TaxID=1233113 RepID=UPI003A8413DA
MRALFLTGLVLSIIALTAVAEETKPVNTFTLLNKPGTLPAVPDYSQGVPAAAAPAEDPGCRVRKTVEAGVSMGGVSGKYAGARLDYGKDDRALDRGYAPNPCPQTGFAMSLSMSASDMEMKRRGENYPAGRPIVEGMDDGMADIGNNRPGHRLNGD